MAMKLFNDNIYLFESSEVKVFPCSYRGEFENNIIDPEARMLTERNFRVTNEKENRSYIDAINLTSFAVTSLNLNINGYYFRINCDTTLSEYIKNGFDTFVISLGDITSIGKITTPILKSVYDSNNQDLKLDFKDSTNNKYYFTGLGLVKSTDSTYTEYLKLKVANYTEGSTTTVNKDALLSGLDIYQLNDFTYKLVGQQEELKRQVNLTLKADATDDQIVTTKQDKTISANEIFSGNNSFTGLNTFANNVIVNGNGAGEQGADTNTVDINVDTTITKAAVEDLQADVLNAVSADINDADIRTADIDHLNADVTSDKKLTIDGGQLVNKSIVNLPGGAGTTTITYSIVIPCYNSIAGVSNYSVLAVVNNALTWVPPYDGSYTITTS